MQMSGEYAIPAPPDMVWRGLNDPAVLQRCIPGCESVERASDTEFTARVVIALGPVKAKFAGKVTLSDLDPPNGYRISGEGQGGVAGFGKGGAHVRLAPDGAGTRLSYTAEASVGGKIAQVGARLIDATAKKLADQFFDAFAREMTASAVAAGAAAPAAVAGPPPAPTGVRLPPAVWVTGLIVLIGVLLWLFARP